MKIIKMIMILLAAGMPTAPRVAQRTVARAVIPPVAMRP